MNLKKVFKAFEKVAGVMIRTRRGELRDLIGRLA